MGRMAGPFIAAIISRLGQIVLAIVIARRFGPEDYGLFIFAVGTSVVVGMIADFGWPSVFNRMMPALKKGEDWTKLKGLARAADLTVFVGGVVGVIFLVALALLVGDLKTGLIAAALLVIPYAFVILRRQQLAAVGWAWLGLLLDQGFASTLLLILLLITPLSIVKALLAYSAFMLLALLIGTLAVRKRLPTQCRNAPPSYDWKPWLSMGGSITISFLPRILMTRVDVLMLAPLAGLAEAGVYGAALRVTILMTFPQFVLQTVALPLFSQAFANGQTGRVRRLFVLCLAYALATSVPVVMVIAIASEWIMGTLFGSDFADGALSLVLLGLGQFAISVGIPFASMITMGDREKAFGRFSLLVLIVNLALGLLLIPLYGATGGAVAVCISSFLLFGGQIWLGLPLLKADANRSKENNTT